MARDYGFGMSRRALFLRNPASAGARAQPERLERFLRALRAGGVETELRLTERPGQAVTLTTELAPTFDLVIAGGGDGTVHEVASGLVASGAAVPLAIAPFGTGNDIAQIVGLPDDPAAVRAITQPMPLALDTVEVTWREAGAERRRHAVLFGGTAFASELLRQTTPRVVRLFGPKLCYSVGFFRALASFRPPTLRVRTAAGEWTQTNGVLALAGNAPHAGGRMMQIGPGASLTDGQLEFTLVEAVGRLELALQFGRLLRGTHVRHPKVRFFRGTWMELDADPPQPLAIDGEVIGTTPARFEVRPRSLTVLGNV
jgi:YegS/Rv2252/BmrU family lipid kinase